MPDLLIRAKENDHMEIGHNVVHRTHTNILGKDRDIGYSLSSS
jgi:hypothetical protein